jgi:flavin reductase (DIM6/NTAB) family NADH-FMN oxidoreductase RutF
MKQSPVVPAASGWKEENIREHFRGTPFSRIGDEWMLITSGNVLGEGADPGNWNTMTASWGGLGVLWGWDIATVYVRPTRYTYEFMNANPLFTLSFFDKAFHNALEICGSMSGRDTDKAAAAGITPVVFGEGPARGAVGFKEARDIIVCRKLYAHDFDLAGFLDPAIEKNYTQKDYHRLYVGEIVSYKTAS